MKKNIEEIDLDRIDECANDLDGIDDQSMTALTPLMLNDCCNFDRVNDCANDIDGIDDNEYDIDDNDDNDDIDSSGCRL